MALYKALKNMDKEVRRPRLAVVENFRKRTTPDLPTAVSAEENRALYDFLLELTPFPISITCLAEGRFLLVNRRWSQLTGYQPADAIGRTAADLGLYHHPDERRKLVDTLERHGEIKFFQSCVRHKNRPPLYYAMYAKKMRYGGRDCLLAMTSFAASEQKAQQYLHQNEGPFEDILRKLHTPQPGCPPDA